MQSYAQHREDLTVIQTLKIADGFFVDLGCADGITHSNTYLLESKGWRGILVDANAAEIEKCRTNRHSPVILRAIVSDSAIQTQEFHRIEGPGRLSHLSAIRLKDSRKKYVENNGGTIHCENVPASTLNELLLQYDVPRCFELLSIDLEGDEISALSGLDLKQFRPRIILAEDNTRLTNAPLSEYLRGHGYFSVHRTGFNEWFVRFADRNLFLPERIMRKRSEGMGEQ